LVLEGQENALAVAKAGHVSKKVPPFIHDYLKIYYTEQCCPDGNA
jgi:hypothetical protein